MIPSISVKLGKVSFDLALNLLSNEVWVQEKTCVDCKKSSKKYLGSSTSQDCEENLHDSLPTSLYFTGCEYEEQVSLLDTKGLYNISSAGTYIDPTNITMDGVLGLGNDLYSVVSKLQQGLPSIYSLHSQEIDAESLIIGIPDFPSLNLTVDSSFSLSYTNLSGVFSYNNLTFPDFPLEFSSLTTYILGPAPILQFFYNDLIWNYECHYFEEHILCNCESELPILYLFIQGHNLTIYQEQYLLAVESVCLLMVRPFTHWVIGMTWLSYIFTTVDLEKKTIQFAEVSIIDKTPPGNFETAFGWEILSGVCIVSLLIYLSAVVLFVCIKKNIAYQANLEKLEEAFQTMLIIEEIK